MAGVRGGRASVAFLAEKLADESEIVVDFSRNNFDRRPLPGKFETQIQPIWERRKAENSKLWNGSKFRLAKIQRREDKVAISLGITDYRDYLGTNWNPNVSEIREIGMRDYRNAQAYLSDPLGVGAFLLTSDDTVVLIRRSRHCAEAQGKLDTPGGHPEPSEVFSSDAELQLETASPNPLANVIARELFASISKEIRDEINIPLELLSRPLLMGVSLNSTSGFRPAAQFFVETPLTSAEVRNLYAEQTQSEAEESTDIIFVPKQKLLEGKEDEEEDRRGEEEETREEGEGRSGALWQELAPNVQGCVMIARRLLKSTDMV